jgi:spore coat protein H
MLRSITWLTTACVAFLLCAASPSAQTTDKKPTDLKRNDVFGLDKVWTIHLTIGAKEYQDMTPTGGISMFGGFGKKDAPPQFKKKPEKKPVDPDRDVHKSKGFGMEFPWVKGNLEFNNKLVEDVGIRYTGNSTYQMSAQGIKRPFKIDVNHYVEDQKIFGMGSLTLRNGAADSTRIRDALGYAVFRAAGVPAPRTAFIKLHLTVPGKYNKTQVGLYTLVESVDKPFLKANFGSNDGMLLKPERVIGLQYLGENWNAYKDRYNPKREPTDDQKKRLIEFTRLVNFSNEATFKQKIDEYLNVDNFLRFAAANGLTTNLDSFFGLGHNYYLYLNPKDNKFHFIPWDLDLAFGGMNLGAGAGASEQIEWSIAEPYMGRNRLTERVLAIKEYDDAYRKHLRTFVEGPYNSKNLGPMIASLEKTVRDAREVGKGFGFGGFGGFGGPQQNLRSFTSKRADSVLAQLDGESQGKKIAAFKFGAPPKAGPKGGPK